MPEPLFDLGRIVATPGALAHLNLHPETSAQALLQRHVSGDFGDLVEHDRQANLDAIPRGERILSAYPVAGERLWVISEGQGDSRVTTVMLSDEY